MDHTEQEQIENLKNWWGDNGWFVVAGVVLGVAILVGWQQWQNWQQREGEAGAALYEELRAAVDADLRNEAAALEERLIEEYSGTPYADHGDLLLARYYMDLNDLDAAAEALRRVAGRTDDPEIRRIAELRLARVLYQQADYEAALAAVERAGAGRFEARALEVKGDIELARGNVDAAREAYQQALDTAEGGLIDRVLVEIKLDDLPPARGDAT